MDLPNRQAYAIFGVVAMALLMASIDATIVAVALPTMLHELSTNLAWIRLDADGLSARSDSGHACGGQTE